MPEDIHIGIAEAPKLNPEILRKGRDIVAMGTDYLSDDKKYTLPERVKYYKDLREKSGIGEIRTEFRLKNMLPDSEKGKPLSEMKFDGQVDSSYTDTLKAMKEAGMEHPTIVLFSPSEWQVELAKQKPEEFIQLYTKYTEHVLDLCAKAGVAPKYLQVMNEVNFAMQTPLSLEMSIALIHKTHEILLRDPRFPETKTMTTVYAGTTREQLSDLESSVKKGASKLGPLIGGRVADLIEMAKPHIGKAIDTSVLGKTLGPYVRWEEFVKDLVDKCGDSLQGLGVDSYPGSYDRPAITLRKNRPLTKSRPFKVYGDVSPFKWAAEQKIKPDGVLHDKDVLITETGVFALSEKSRQQKMGFMRIVQALDHTLLEYEKEGIKASDIFKGIMFFQVGEHAGVDVKAPMSLDFRPWTLLRKGKNGEWVSTEAIEDRNGRFPLKNLIDTRINVKPQG